MPSRTSSSTLKSRVLEKIQLIADEYSDYPHLPDFIITRAEREWFMLSNPELLQLFKHELNYAILIGIDDSPAWALARVRLKDPRQSPAAHLAAGLKAGKAAIAKEREELFAGAKKPSKSPVPGTRVFPKKDLKYVHCLGLAERRGYLDTPGLVGVVFKKEKLKDYAPPHWDHTTLPLKVLIYSILTYEAQGNAFTLLLSKEMSKKALAGRKGVASYIQERIKEALAKEFGQRAPDFWFGIETKVENGETLFHVHGGIMPADFVRVQKALRAAGGEWSSTAGAHHQLVMKTINRPYNWASYVLKEINTTAETIPNRIIGVTRQLSAQAKVRWTTLRPALPKAA